MWGHVYAVTSLSNLPFELTYLWVSRGGRMTIWGVWEVPDPEIGLRP
jgi:hypothetical protein